MSARQSFVARSSLATLLVFAALPAAVLSQEGNEEVAIQDNSFLIEEAYNQQKGIIQHIFNWAPSWDVDHGVRHRQSDFLFTQEWPILSQTHQFSYSIPINRFTDQACGGPIVEAEGIGDIMLNYRCQVLGGKGQQLSFAPRFSVILPSGDENQRLGNGQVGYQVNLPLSKEFGHWCFHFNAGTTVTPGVTAGLEPQPVLPGQPLSGYNLGGSAIYKLRPNFHLMLETLAVSDEELTAEGNKHRSHEVQLSPGFRWAPYTKGDVQWVLGVAAPIGLTRDAPDLSLFFYMSFEHPFTIAPRPEEKQEAARGGIDARD